MTPLGLVAADIAYFHIYLLLNGTDLLISY